jgi:DNA invertase Pin-like site-specific DNA recombinase
MSTGKQLAGDSRRRQLELSRKYALAHGLKLAEGAELEDIGISAFKGKNTKDGRLGWFLHQVESGKIPKGSFLLVESLDRISRQNPNESMSKFLGIINAGINLVTLFDGKAYRSPCSMEDLVLPLMILSRAHNESKEKGERVAAAWAEKRKTAANECEPMSGRCPAWLELAPDRKSYVPVADHVDTVRSMFEDAASLGIHTITRNLNKAGKLSFGTGRKWQESSVRKILASKAVIGEFQPHRLVDGKRIPDGKPIEGYFPSIIDEQLFYQVQEAKTERKRSGAGRKGKNYSNLFTGLIKCIYCKSTVSFENKGVGHGGTYLVCDGFRRALGCPGRRWKYQDFEMSFLSIVEEVDLRSIVESVPSEHVKMEAQLAAIDGQLSEVRLQKRNVFKLLSNNGGLELADETINFIKSELDELSRQEALLERSAQEKKQACEYEKSNASLRRATKEELEELISRLQNSEEEELYKLRARIASRLRRLTRYIFLGSVGTRAPTKAVEWLKSQQTHESERIASYMEEMALHPSNSRRFFCVMFQDDDVRIVYPDRENPLLFNHQVLTSEMRKEVREDRKALEDLLKLAEIFPPELYFGLHHKAVDDQANQ